MNVRNIRLLDPEPAEPTTLPIVKGIPVPKPRYCLVLTNTLKKLQVGECFLADSKQKNHVHDRAKPLGIKVVMRKVESDKWRVWRIA